MVITMSDVKLPGIGSVPKPAVIAVGAASVAILAYAWYRHNTGATADTTTTDTTAVDDTSIDPATGVPYADEFGYGNSGYSFQGITDPTTGTVIGTGVGTGVVTQATSNAAWAQTSQSYLVTYGGFQDPQAVAAALGAGLLGHYMTPDQLVIWNAAVAFEGDPPQGHPPINSTPPVGQPPINTKLPAPSGFKVTGTTVSHVGLSWSAVPGALEYHVKIKGGSLDHTIITHSLAYTFGDLKKNTTYQFNLMAQNGAGTGAATPTLSAKTKAK